MSEDAVRKDILRLEENRLAALRTGDVAALAELMADDLVHIHGNGHMDDKAAYLQGVRDKYTFHRIERGDLKVRIYGDLVVVNGPVSQAVSVTGIDKINEIRAMATQTWIRGDGGWKQNTCHMGFLSIV